MDELLTVADVERAAERIRPLLPRTPLLQSEELSEEFGARVLVKAESLQITGSFKPRGVLNTLLSWREAGRLPEGVVGFSAGNHAAALAYAGRRLGVRSVVSMPVAARRSKVLNVRRYGGEIVYSDDLMGTCAELGERYGWPALYPFDLNEVMAGQGTIWLEIAEEVPEPDLVLVPVGGGGLIGGISTAAKVLSPGTRVVGVEPAESNALGRAMRAGHVVTLPPGCTTIADGLAAPFAGKRPLAQAQRYVDQVCEVSEEEIQRAWRDMVHATKLVLEASAVVGLAALRSGAVRVPEGGTVVLVATGGNADEVPAVSASD